jgi:transposase
LVFIPRGRRTATDFVEILYDVELLNFMRKITRGVLMEDDAPMHHLNATNEWQKLKLIEKLVWLPNSPDLNPIENVWAILKDVVQHRGTHPKTINDMKQVLQEE